METNTPDESAAETQPEVETLVDTKTPTAKLVDDAPVRPHESIGSGIIVMARYRDTGRLVPVVPRSFEQLDIAAAVDAIAKLESMYPEPRDRDFEIFRKVTNPGLAQRVSAAVKAVNKTDGEISP